MEQHPTNSTKTRWCPCTARCKGGAYVHPKTYGRHKVHREADAAREREDFYEQFGRPAEIIAVPVRKTCKVREFYTMSMMYLNF
jgi:hypothetical protein